MISLPPEPFYFSRALTIVFFTFLIGVIWTPSWIRWLKKARMGKQIRAAADAPIMNGLHAGKNGTPTMGGVVVWGTVAMVLILSRVLCILSPSYCSWNFLSRAQTVLPFGALIAAAMLGLVDDYFNIRGIGPKGGGLPMRFRLFSYSLIAVVVSWWFVQKLDWTVFHIPFYGTFTLGLSAIVVYAFIIIATSFSVNETDGLDGLAGGPLLTSFGAYAVIAFAQGKYDLGTFCAAIVGALLAFLWWNVPPASFFMGDTGAMSLGTVLAVVALQTNQPLLLMLIGLPFVVESISVFIQIASKKIRKKKIFLSAPIHHHFEAIGWKECQIVFRTWIISLLVAGVGVVLALMDR